MKSKRKKLADAQILEYERLIEKLSKELLRMESLRELNNRDYFPRELEKMDELARKINQLKAEQVRLFLLIKKEDRPFLQKYRSQVAAFILLMAISLPMCFHSLSLKQVPKSPSQLSIDPIPPKQFKRKAVPIYPIDPKPRPFTAKLELAPQLKPKSSLAKELMTYNFRDSLTNHLRIRETFTKISIWNRSPNRDTLRFELFNHQKELLYSRSFKYLNSVFMDKAQFSSQVEYFYQVTSSSEGSILYLGKFRRD